MGGAPMEGVVKAEEEKEDEVLKRVRQQSLLVLA